MPVPETNGEEWDRLEPASALDVLIELALHGEYNGLESTKRIQAGLELRAAAVGVFEVSFDHVGDNTGAEQTLHRTFLGKMKSGRLSYKRCFLLKAQVQHIIISLRSQHLLRNSSRPVHNTSNTASPRPHNTPEFLVNP
jgi:hypothetical protein